MIVDEDIYLENSDNETVINQEVDRFLEHYGILGMKWGVRNDQRSNKGSSKSTSKGKIKKRKLTAKQKAKRNIRITNAVIYSVGATMMVAGILGSAGQQRASTVRPARVKSAVDIINARRNTEVSALKRMRREGHMDDDQLRNFKAILNARYDRRVVESKMRDK